MEDLHKMIQNYTIRHDRKIKQICAPLRVCFGITAYSHYTIDREGNFTFLSDYPEQVDFYFGQRLYESFPFFVHPDFMQPGCLLTETTPDPDYREVIDKRFHLRELFLIVEKKLDLLHISIFSNNKNPLNNILSKYELLKKFNSYFYKEATPLMNKMRADHYNLARAKGKSFFERPSEWCLQDQQLSRFLKQISPLTRREHQCLELYQSGYTAKETAKFLGLSHRTVEQHFENIKNKLNLYSKREVLNH